MCDSISEKELLIDLIAREQWSIDYHERGLRESKAKLNVLEERLKNYG